METTKSADGTIVAYDRTGDGPPLVIVLGAFCDRKTFVPPASMTGKFTVITYDRRGRGDSGDTQPYSPAREIADLAAVIKAVSGSGTGASGSGASGTGASGSGASGTGASGSGASGSGASGSGAFVFGHSSGAALALLAAAHGVPMFSVVAYEAPFVIPGTREVAKDPTGRITALVSAGRRADAVKFWMADVVKAPAEMIPVIEKSPAWAGLQALAHTLPYDLALTGDQGVPVDDLAKISVPVLVLGGANSPDWFHRTVEATTDAIPGARLVMLDGQDHGAPPEVIAPVLTEFFLGSLGRPGPQAGSAAVLSLFRDKSDIDRGAEAERGGDHCDYRRPGRTDRRRPGGRRDRSAAGREDRSGRGSRLRGAGRCGRGRRDREMGAARLHRRARARRRGGGGRRLGGSGHQRENGPGHRSGPRARRDQPG
jgi:pimeloyl-ACP methyl ester carboxylesterase